MSKKKRAKGAGAKHKFKGDEPTKVIGFRVPVSAKKEIEEIKLFVHSKLRPYIKDPYRDKFITTSDFN